MTIGNIQISRSFIIGGSPLVLTDKLKVRHPKVKDIVSIEPEPLADAIYLTYISVFLCDPYDYAVWLDDRGIDYETVSAFDVLVMKIEEQQTKTGLLPDELSEALMGKMSCASALNFFLDEHEWTTGVKENGQKILFDRSDPEVYIDGERFEIISAFVRMVNNIAERKDRIKPANASAKKILLEDMRDEQKRQKNKSRKDEDNDYLGDAIATVLHGGGGGVTWFNYKELPIYEIMSGYSISQKQLAYKALLTGVYTGNVKSESLTKKEMEWMK